MKKIKKKMKKIEDAMAAAAFAEAGEFETAREMLKEERRVLLAVRNGLIDGKTLKYALNTSKRVGANLDILVVSSTDYVHKVLEDFLTELQQHGISYRFIQKRGCLKKAIIDYTGSEGDILFVVIESSDTLDLDCSRDKRSLSNAWMKLQCPLVVVMDTI